MGTVRTTGGHGVTVSATKVHMGTVRTTGVNLGTVTVMSQYHKMATNEYPNIFGCHIMYRMNIRIFSDATYLPNEYPNIFVFRK